MSKMSKGADEILPKNHRFAISSIGTRPNISLRGPKIRGPKPTAPPLGRRRKDLGKVGEALTKSQHEDRCHKGYHGRVGNAELFCHGLSGRCND